MRIVFFGTPQFAVPILQGLLDQAAEVVGVYTSPDRASGRGRGVTIASVKELAIARNIRVFQPPSFRNLEAVDELRGLEPDVLVVAAYGKILPPSVLGLPPYGCLNVHPSLLPKHRGPSPVAAAILAGDEETGISIMQMDAGVDTGPVVIQKKILIDMQDTAGTLGMKLSTVATDLLLGVLPKWVEGAIEAQPQGEEGASYCHLIEKGNGLIDWGLSAEILWRQVRAYNPWPGSFTRWGSRLLKILDADFSGSTTEQPGRVLELAQDKVGITCGEGLLEPLQVQVEGRRPMAIDQFLKGQPGFKGATLGG